MKLERLIWMIGFALTVVGLLVFDPDGIVGKLAEGSIAAYVALAIWLTVGTLGLGFATLIVIVLGMAVMWLIIAIVTYFPRTKRHDHGNPTLR